MSFCFDFDIFDKLFYQYLDILYISCSNDNNVFIDICENINIQNYNDLLCLSCKYNNIELIKYYINKGANNLNEAIIHTNKIEIIEYLISLGANVNQ